MPNAAPQPLFRKLVIEGWRQIEFIDIDFHRQLTVLTGANGSGKTTLLNLLARHFGWSMPLVSTPDAGEGGVVRFLTGFWRRAKAALQTEPAAEPSIGRVEYTTGNKAEIHLPANVDRQYQVSLRGQQTVEGLYIPSHRPVYAYQQVDNIPTRPRTRQQAYNDYSSYAKQMYQGSSARTPNYTLKETLISLALFGEGNRYVAPDLAALETFKGFEGVLARVLPDTLGFREIAIQPPEVLLDTASGRFSLDAVSGGIAAIIDLAWQIYMRFSEHQEYVVLIDEPENHLHPKMQRSVLPNLMAAFPECQFIVSTHNPFIISAVKDSHVYVLAYNQDRRVQSSYLDFANKAGSSNEILRDVLGLESTLPIWVVQVIDALADRLAASGATPESLAAARSELSRLGFDHLFPEALARLAGGRQEP